MTEPQERSPEGDHPASGGPAIPSRRDIDLLGSRTTVLPAQFASDHARLERGLDAAVAAVEETLADIDQAERRYPRHLRWREQARANPLTNALWRVGVALAGAVLLAAGVAMLILPGPGWATIAVGLLVLASEFQWAQRLTVPLRRAIAWVLDRWVRFRPPGRSRRTPVPG